MRCFFIGLLVFLSLSSCDDGDIITVELDFDGVLERCDNNTDEFLMYDVLEDPDEALILVFPRTTANELMFVTEIPEDDPTVFTIDDNSIRFIYRTYSSQPTFCQIVDDGQNLITGDFSSDSGTVEVSTSFVDDDNDGIPSSVEDANLDGDNNPATNPTNSDDDNIPDYLDQDDDNDNVKTEDENPDPNGDGDVSDAQDTDDDGIPDYLDEDDDGDLTPTRLEDENGDQNPATQFDIDEESPNNPTLRYLDPLATEEFDDPGKIFNEFTRTYTTKFIVDSVDLEIIRYERRTYGTYTTVVIFSNEE